MESVNDSVGDDNLSEIGNMKEEENVVEPESKVVSREHHRKLLAQRKRDQEILRQQNEELEAFRKAEAEKEQTEQTKRGEFEKVLQSVKQENEKLKGELENIQTSSVKHTKYQAVVDALPGKLGNPKYVAFIDIDDVFIDPTTNTIDEASVKAAADKFAKEHASLLAAADDIPRLPNDAPRDKEKSSGFGNYNDAKEGLREGLSAVLGNN